MTQGLQKEKPKLHYTAWAAVLATAAELTRKQYDVTLTFGNTPKVDLLCSIPDSEKQFKVQVKGITNKAGLRVQKNFFEGSTQQNLVFVIVLVSKDQPFRFFIMTHEEVRAAWSKWCKERIEKGYYVSMCEECWNGKNPGKQAVRFSDEKERECDNFNCRRRYKSGFVLTRKDGRPYMEGVEGLAWEWVRDHENKWDKFKS